MKAIELHKYGSAKNAFRFVDRDIPVPKANEVVIKVEYTGLNFADVVARRGLYPDAPKNPAVLGYDVVGTVHQLGSEVNGLLVGDRVTALTRFGGYAEYACTMKEGVAKIPDSMDPAAATALATQACTAYYSAEYMYNLRKGDNVLIHAAAGGVGSILVQLAKYRGCTVFATASASKSAYLESIGADHIIDYRNKDFKSEIQSILGGNKIDVVFDSIGGSTFKKSWQLLQACGSLISYGAASQISGNNKLKALGAVFGFGLFSPIQLLMQSRSLLTVNMLRVADNKAEKFQEVLKKVIQFSSEGIIKPKLGRVFDVQDIAEAHDYLESRKSIGKIVLKWQS